MFSVELSNEKLARFLGECAGSGTEGCEREIEIGIFLYGLVNIFFFKDLFQEISVSR